MDDFTIRVLLFSLPVLTGLAWVWASRRDRRRQYVQKRLLALTEGGDEVSPQTSLLRVAPKSTSLGLFLPQALRSRLDGELAAAGNSIGILHLLISCVIAALIIFGFTSRILALNSGLVMLLTAGVAGLAPFMVLRMAQSRYQSRFLEIFPDALDLIGRAIKAGLPVNEALVVAGKEMADPVGGDLRRSCDEVQLGVQLIEALEKTANRVRVPDFRFMVVALALQQGSGGSLAETLTNLSKVIRARKAIRLKARGLSAEAKVSALVLAILPFVVGGMMCLMNRDFMNALFIDPRGRFMLGVASVSLVTGLLIMYLMIKRAVR